jgi:putative oxidoreductase
MWEQLQGLAALVGRVLLSSIFLISGATKVLDWSATAQMMEGKRMVLVTFLLAATIFCELVGGLSLLLGFCARWGALLLIVYLIPATLVMHNFWQAEPAAYQDQMIQFMKNVAIIGGLFVVTAFGPG